MHTLYGDREFKEPHICPDFRVRIDPGIRKLRRCVYASVNGQIWEVWPKRLTVGALEWVCNWCFSRGTVGKLALHAAAAEIPTGKGAIVFPGLSGAGKSTLAATLMLSGWRLLSDEIALFDTADYRLTALGRPTILKGHSLDLISDNFPEKAVFGPAGRMLAPPGKVAHLRPSFESTEISGQRFDALAFCFPERRPDSTATLEHIDQAECFSKLAKLGLNYRFLGPDGFDTLLGLINQCPAYRLIYTNATDAEELLRSMSSSGDFVGMASSHIGSQRLRDHHVVGESTQCVSSTTSSVTAAPLRTCRTEPQDGKKQPDIPSSSKPRIPIAANKSNLDGCLDPARQKLVAALRGQLDLKTLSLHDWDSLLLVATHLELVSQLATSISSAPSAPTIPPEVALTLDNARQLVAFNHKHHDFEFQFLQRIAAASKTRPVLLKGSAYIATKERWADGRKTGDIDLLLTKSNLQQFERELECSGYKTSEVLSALDRRYYRKWLHELPPYTHTYRGVEIDVHFRLLPVADPKSFPIEDWVERSVSLNEMPPFRVLDPVDQVLHAIINLGHVGEFRRATRDAWDISCLTSSRVIPDSDAPDKERSDERTVAGFDWQELHRRTLRLNLQKTVANVLLLCDELVGLSIPPNFVEDLTGKSKNRLKQSFIYRTMETASLPEGPTLRSRKRYFALWALEHYPLPKPSTWLDPLTWTKRFHFLADD